MKKRFCPDINHNLIPNRKCKVCKQPIAIPCDRCEDLSTNRCIGKENCERYENQSIRIQKECE